MTVSMLIGLGEVGSAIREVINPQHVYDIRDGDFPVIYDTIDLLHIAIPYGQDFVDEVAAYARRLTFSDDSGIIIYSTVKVGTTRKVCDETGIPAAHSPIEGVHPHLAESITNSTRWIGSCDLEHLDRCGEFWERFVPSTELLDMADHTEFLKLRSTSKYGINLVWTDYEAKVAAQIGMPLEYLKAFDADYNTLYLRLGKPQYQRYILDPPNGVIGGHCVVPNAKLLKSQFPNEMLDMIVDMEASHSGLVRLP